MAQLLEITLANRDPDRAALFYQAMGYRPAADDQPGFERRLALDRRRECRLTIVPRSDGEPPADFLAAGVLTIDFYVSDLTNALQALEQAGGSVWSGPVDYQFGPNPVRHAMMSGPGGERVGLLQVTHKPAFATWSPADSLFSEPAICPIGVSDLPASLAYYTGVLGWTIAGESEVGAGPVRDLIRIPADTPARVVLLNTGGPSQPRIELIAAGAAIEGGQPPARPSPLGTGFIGFAEPGAGDEHIEPSGVRFRLKVES